MYLGGSPKTFSMAERRKTTLTGWFSKLFRAAPEGASGAPVSTPIPPVPPISDVYFNVTADGLIIVNLLDGLVTRANSAAEKLLGYSPGGLIGVHFSRLLPPSTANQHTTVQQRLRGMGSVSEGQAFYRRDGAEIPCDLLMTLLSDPAHPVAVLNLRDASEREARAAKQEEALRLHAEAEALKESYRQKDQFISLLAHQLRTPMAVIHSAAGMVSRYSERMTAEKRHEHLTRIQTHAKLASAFIEDLRFLNRADAREVTIQVEPFDLTELVQRAVKPYHDHPNQPRIHLTMPPPPVMVPVDEILFNRMLEKLMSNAVIYSPFNGVIEVTLHLDGEMVCLSVADKGMGIPTDFLPRAFEPYQRASNIGEIDGMGVGLTVARTCVRLLRGEITLESAVDKGTTAQICLPSSP